LYRTLQELLINSKKHAQASLIYLTISQDGEIISGTYSDNGKGASELKIENGLTNMEIRILALNGTINFETSNGNGFKASFKF
jgi:signal transduction histidine kinase